MISDLFFYGKLKDVKNKLIYEEDFVVFYLNVKIKDKEKFYKEDIEILLEQLYGKENIKNNGILKFCEKHFIQNEKTFYLNISDEEKEFYEKVSFYANEIMQIKSIDKNELYNTIEKEVFNVEIPFHIRLKNCITYYYWESDLKLETKIILLYKYFQALKDYYKIYRIIDNKLEKIPELFNVLEITELDMTEQQLSFLIFNNIYSLKNLKSVPINVLICVFCNCLEKFINEIGNYAFSKEEIIKKLNEICNKALKPEWADVIERRFDFETNKKRTLADIGKELHLTRERIRQIEKKATFKLLEHGKELNDIIYCFYRDINKENKNFITVDEFLKYVKNEELVRYLIIILGSEEISIEFSEEYGIIYNKKELTLDGIISEAKDGIKDIIPVSEMEDLNIVQQKILDNEYRIYQNKILVKKSLNISAIYMNEIKENFVNGYDIGSEEDYNKLIRIVTEKYGDIEMSSMHSIQAMIDRNDFIQIDRGTYISREHASNLSEKLTDEIINYIINNSPVIAYSMIFEKFKNRLEKIGISNRFYLKGLLDEKLPEEFSTGRDFINTNSEENVTTYDVMREIFKSFDEEFTIDDLREKMPGLKGYNYENYARAEEQNGLIRMATKTYIYIDKLNITEETIYELKKYIDNLFEKIDSKILTSKKIYASLSIMNKELLSKLNIKARFGDFELFSIIQYLYKDNYYYSRPIISLEENITTTSYLLIKEYAERLDKFNYNDIKNYIFKMNIGGLYSYLSFIDDMSDKYVQINIDSMIRKEKLNITEENLQKIHDFIDMLVKDKSFKTDNFDGYFMLPKIEKPWNKYMLVGLIRSYFKEEFEIENTTNFYDTTDFVVRRI